MPNATVRANARSMPKSSDQPDAAHPSALAKELAAAAKAYDETMHAIEEAEERCRSITSPPVRNHANGEGQTAWPFCRQSSGGRIHRRRCPPPSVL